MIDWGLVLFPLVHQPINSGEVFSIAADGEVEWRSPKRVQAEGAFPKQFPLNPLVVTVLVTQPIFG